MSDRERRITEIMERRQLSRPTAARMVDHGEDADTAIRALLADGAAHEAVGEQLATLNEGTGFALPGTADPCGHVLYEGNKLAALVRAYACTDGPRDEELLRRNAEYALERWRAVGGQP